MSVFLGIGLGPIQSGIFLSGAGKGGFDRKVIAEVDPRIKESVNATGSVTINIAADDRVYTETIEGVEILNPADPADLDALVEVAAQADEVATALPSVDFFPRVIEWLKKGFMQVPDKYRVIYTAENNNHAAEEFMKALGPGFPNIACLNTVVGKMSGVVTMDDCKEQNLELLCPGSDRGHLVEEFNKILISEAPGIENRKVQGLISKPDLYPFEEAKLYGHNAIHFLLGILAGHRGLEFMSEIRAHKDLMQFGRQAFVDESGVALCRKWAGTDALFTQAGYKEYAEDLLVRMTNPFLRDAVTRIVRDLPRKLSWNDRMTGTIRVVLSQDVKPVKLAAVGRLASAQLFGDDPAAMRKGFAEIWPQPWTEEHEQVLRAIADSCEKELPAG